MKMNRTLSIVAGILVALLVISGMVSSFFVDLWWFTSLGYESVFWKTWLTQYGLWIGGFVLFLLIILPNLRVALRSESNLTVDPRLQAVVDGFGRIINWLSYAVSAFLAFIMASMISGTWMDFLAMINSDSFSLVDPVFGNDVSFYLFTLPFLNSAVSWLIGSTVLTLLAVFLVYIVRQGISFAFGRMAISAAARKHLAILAAQLFVLIAVSTWLGRYDILNSTRSGSFYGAGYADIHAQLPAAWILSILSLLTAGVLIYSLYSRQFKLLVRWMIGYVIAAIVLTSLFPSLVQKFIVNPNEQSKELPYISNNIEFTRHAFDLTRIEEKPIDPKYDLRYDDIVADSATVRNIMLWDYRPLASTLDQLQVIRLYYSFTDVDVDRYRLPDGSYRQVMLSPRELDQNKLPANAQTWVNLNLVYTHGYGLAMAPVNVVTSEGLPELFIRDIPPQSEHGLQIDQPEIYFGEATRRHVVVKGNIEEFDYPLGDQNQMTRYREDAGVHIGSMFRRLMFAIHYGELNMLISGYISSESRILYNRLISDRVRKIAPFLAFDDDPYIVVAGGRLQWIYDAYTFSSVYPYSKPAQGFNYIRNSVKVVIDAYTGETKFYLFDNGNDPMVRVYQRMFPALFQPRSEFPEELENHVRYPQDLFDVQSEVFATYHMRDPQVFYNKEDLWNIATEKMQETVVRMESYYAIMRLPGEPKEEFIQMIPYTPNRRDNMIAWLCARSDGDNYGKLLVYKFSKKEQIFGPMQVVARIDQDPYISQQIALWNQHGSSVYRGNLLVIPIKEEVLYVQPIYLQATAGKLPELKRVIVAYHNRLAMEETLDQALMRVFRPGARTLPRPELETVEETAARLATEAVPTAERNVRELSRAAMDAFNRAIDAQKSGDWARYGEEIEKLKKDLDELVRESER
jgi:uncharacterized protein